ncbi:MAG TPA: dihydroorotate dehydrogenase electron transfer subunit [Pirellulales bacterium]|nr:dihydroorotate dehydrogenase electron transfer subunit [Pirellulales bacterium]
MGLTDATCFADRARYRTVVVRENVKIARDTYRVRFDCPEIAQQIVPGQFLMMRLSECNDPLLGRPLAFYDVVVDQKGIPVGLDVVYLVVGKFTSRLARASAGQQIDVWGPLGNGFTPRPAGHLVMVAGGIGQTPFLALAREYLGTYVFGDPPRAAQRAERVTLCYGARSQEYLAGLEDFTAAGVRVLTSTDDGSAGRHGLVTDVLREVIAAAPRPSHIVCCGPEPMMHAVAEIAKSAQISCEVSLESPMACGIGICFSCVAKVRDASGGWDYRRTCVEGPVFDAATIEF